MKLRFLAVASIAVLTPATAFGGGGTEPPAETVKVADYYFSPSDVRIKAGETVVWKWSKANYESHNVTLTGRVPTGVRKSDFKSGSGPSGIRFAPTFKKPGTYDFVCRFHPTQMAMSVKVKP